MVSKLIEEERRKTDDVQERANAVLESAWKKFEQIRTERDKAAHDLAAVRIELAPMRAERDAFQLQLETERAEAPTERVYVEPEVAEREADSLDNEPATRFKSFYQSSAQADESTSSSVLSPPDVANSSRSSRGRSIAFATSKRSLSPPASDVTTDPSQTYSASAIA